jgi:hypothetical protein
LHGETRNPARSGRARGTRQPSGEWLAVAGCVALSLTLRLWALSFQPWVTVDGTEYIRSAEAWMRGQLFVCLFPPGYPALIALAHLLVPDRVMAASWASLICGALLPWPVWKLARSALPGRWALVPALVVALHPALMLHSVVTLSESAYLLALYGALALAPRPLAAGLAIGAAFAIRPEALVPAAALALREIVRRVRGATTIRAPLLFVAGFLALAIPCWVYFHAEFGTWTLSPKLEDIRRAGSTWVEAEPRLGPALPARERFGVLERLARTGPDLVRRYPANLLGHLKALHGLWPVSLMALSLWGLALRRGRLEAVPLLHLAVLPLAAISFLPRFVLGTVPALAVLAVVPIATATVPAVRWAAAAAGIAGALWAGAIGARDLKLPYDGYEATHLEAGQWLSGASEPGEVVTDRKPYVAFYADRPYRVMPLASYDQIIDEAVHSGVRYLVVDEGVARVFRPQLLPLLSDPAFRARENRLEMIYVGGHAKGYGIALFKVLQPGESKSGAPPYFDVRWLGRTSP